MPKFCITVRQTACPFCALFFFCLLCPYLSPLKSIFLSISLLLSDIYCTSILLFLISHFCLLSHVQCIYFTRSLQFVKIFFLHFRGNTFPFPHSHPSVMCIFTVIFKTFTKMVFTDNVSYFGTSILHYFRHFSWNLGQ